MGSWGRSTWVLVLFAAIATVVLVWVILDISQVLATGGALTEFDLRPTLLCLSLIGLSVVSYAVWFSRWNILAHTQLAFSLVAYVVPIAFLGVLEQMPSEALDRYFQVAIAGFFFTLIGTLFGGWLGRTYNVERLRSRASFDRPEVQTVISRRLFAIASLSVVGVVASFAVMGFIPALAADPFAAKFFKGAYAASYAPVAPLYRAATSAISLLMPLIALHAWRTRSLGWILVFVGSTGVLLLGLLRDPAISGLLLLIGVAVAVRGRGLALYFVVLVGAYFVGGALYFLLDSFGFEGFASARQSSDLLQEVAAGAPDVSDQVKFLQSWLLRPEYTNGLTFIGGLVPGNFQWNPSVWSLHVVNPGADIANVNSGGLRLPAPIWGLVSFGWAGVAGVSLVSGLLVGYCARVAQQLVPSTSLLQSTLWLVLYAAVLDVVTVFYRLSYLSVLQLVIVAMLLFWRVSSSRSAAALPEPVAIKR